MEIIQNKALLLKVRNPSPILASIPKSQVVEEHNGIYKVLVYYGLEEVQVLKNLGIKKVPSPILHRYKWPGIYKPFTHQRETAAFLTLHRRSYCFSDPGTGKTASIAWAADYLMKIGAIKRCLISGRRIKTDYSV